MVNHDYLRKSAQRYYMIMLTLAIDQMKRIWTEKFLFYLSASDSHDLSHDMQQLQYEILHMADGDWDEEVVETEGTRRTFSSF